MLGAATVSGRSPNSFALACPPLVIGRHHVGVVGGGGAGVGLGVERVPDKSPSAGAQSFFFLSFVFFPPIIFHHLNGHPFMRTPSPRRFFPQLAKLRGTGGGRKE